MKQKEQEDLFKPQDGERRSRTDTFHIRAIVAVFGMLFAIAIGYLMLLDPILDLLDGNKSSGSVTDESGTIIPLGELHSIPLPPARVTAVRQVPPPDPVQAHRALEETPEKTVVPAVKPEPAREETAEPAPVKDYQKKMQSLGETHEASLLRAREEHAENDISLHEMYASALLLLMQKLQQTGNLDYWVQVRDELERFKKDGTIPTGDSAEALQEIKLIRERYLETVAKHRARRSSEIILLYENYIHLLKSIQTQLTIDERIEDALEVRKVIRQVSESEELLSSRFDLAVYESNLKKTGEQSDPARTGTASGSAVTSASGSAPRTVTGTAQGAQTGTATTPPSAPKKRPLVTAPVISSVPMVPPAGVTFTKLPMQKIEERPIRSMDVVVMVGNSSNMNSSASNQSDISSRLDEVSIKHHVRIAVKAKLRKYIQRNAVFALQYFAMKPGGDPEANVPSIITSDFFAVSEIPEEGVYVDCPPVETYKSSYSYNTASFSRLLDTESVLSGLILTIFDSKGKIVFQAVSHQSLASYGAKELPRRFSR